MDKAERVFEKLAEKKKRKKPFIGPVGAGVIGGALGGGVGHIAGKAVQVSNIDKLINYTIDFKTGQGTAGKALKYQFLKKVPKWGAIAGAIPLGYLAFKTQKDSYK